LENVKWGEFKLGDLFEIKGNPQLNKDSFSFNENGTYPYFTRTAFNNGILGYVDYLDEEHKMSGNCLAVGMIAMQFFYMQRDFYAGQFTKRAIPKLFSLTPRLANYFISLLNKNQQVFQNVLIRDFERVFNKTKIQLPTKNGKIDFEFMESFITQLEAARIAELEAERMTKLEAYLLATGLKDYTLTNDEKQVLVDFENVNWGTFNLEKLFGKSTRGRRLKSDDRILGTLPFVTAGETDEGISAFIGNDVNVFSKNTTTIDMFGSAKYRNYEYGGDDHIAVVHTEKLPKFAAIFVTTAIHRVSYAGQFSYGRNFYAKDADELNISLPVKNQQPNYELMATFISAIQKMVIKEVVLYADRKIAATKSVVNKAD
jgi:hypothetical protein